MTSIFLFASIMGFVLLVVVPAAGIIKDRTNTRKEIELWASAHSYELLQVDVPWLPFDSPLPRKLTDGRVGFGNIEIRDRIGRVRKGVIQISGIGLSRIPKRIQVRWVDQ